MTLHSCPEAQVLSAQPARNWVRTLAKYREPDLARSIFELTVSALPFLTLAALSGILLSVSYWLAFALALLNGGFLVRLFIIQHDYGHGSYFSNRRANNWVGRIIGVFTLTPYKFWRRTHSIHHSASGNLDQRGIGDVYTMTVLEYQALPKSKRILYRIYRNPLFLFGLGPVLLFVFHNRLPFGLMKSWEYWASAMGTNIVISITLGLVVWFGGLMPLLLIVAPTLFVAATAGVWLFYGQHQFENTQWEHDSDWQLHDAALHGSSYYVLPVVLRWFSGNIGIHHVHHLYSRIPFYRLMEVLRTHTELATINRISIRESLNCIHLHLWDENKHRLVSYQHPRTNMAVCLNAQLPRSRNSLNFLVEQFYWVVFDQTTG